MSSDEYRFLKPACSGTRHKWYHLDTTDVKPGRVETRSLCELCGNVRRHVRDESGDLDFVDYLIQA